MGPSHSHIYTCPIVTSQFSLDKIYNRELYPPTKYTPYIYARELYTPPKYILYIQGAINPSKIYPIYRRELYSPPKCILASSSKIATPPRLFHNSQHPESWCFSSYIFRTSLEKIGLSVDCVEVVGVADEEYLCLSRAASQCPPVLK